MNINDSNIRPELTFRRLVYLHMQQLTNFPYIEKDFDALTDYELLCLVVKYLNDVIDNSNKQNTSITNLYNAFLELQTYMNNSVQELEDAWNDKTTELEDAWNDKTTELETAFNNLQTWIDNYFDNLDVQEEINNKLDKMLEDGVLEQIIEQFLQSTALWCFDTVADMKLATNLINGSYAKTLGYYSVNDGGGATYKITNTESQTEYQEELPNNLYATLIVKNNYNVLQFGVKNDGSTDSSTIVQNILQNIMERDEVLLFPEGLYLFNSPIDMTNCIKRHIKGNFFYNYSSEITNGLLFNNCNGFINCRSNQFDNLLIRGNTDTYSNNGFQGSGMVINNCSISYFNNGINGSGVFTKNTINRCNTAITGCVDSKIINNTINANKHDGINLYQGCNDNVISENKIEWNERSGIGGYNTTHNVITNNIIDRNTNVGISLITCTGEIITNNCLRRNGLGSTTKNRSQFYIEGGARCIICNNSTQANNSQDDGSGTVVPQYSLEINTSNNMYLIGNDLSGGTQTNPIYFGNGNENVRILGSINERLYKYRTEKSISSNSGTNTFDLHCIKTGDYSQPNFHRLIATCRTGQDSGYGFLEFYVYNYKQYGSNVVRLTQTTINNDLTMAASYDSTDDKFYLTITNASTSQNYNVQIYEY